MHVVENGRIGVALVAGEFQRRAFLRVARRPLLTERPIRVNADLVAGGVGDEARCAEVIESVVLDRAAGFERGKEEAIAINVVALDQPGAPCLLESRSTLLSKPRIVQCVMPVATSKAKRRSSSAV